MEQDINGAATIGASDFPTDDKLLVTYELGKLPNDFRLEIIKSRISARSKSLELLYDYTKFHIGLYLTLTASYIAVASVKLSDGKGTTQFLDTDPYLMTFAVVCFLLAGFAAGVIASSITQFTAGGAKEFLASRIGPWNSKLVYDIGKNWTYLEHTAFWLGLFAAIISIALPRVLSP